MAALKCEPKYVVMTRTSRISPSKHLHLSTLNYKNHNAVDAAPAGIAYGV